MRTRMKVVCATALLVLVAAAATAWATTRSDPGVSGSSIKIGGTFPLSGPASLYGTIPRAEAAYFAWFNAHQKIHGRKIDFKYVDDGYDPSQTFPLTRQRSEEHT